MEIVLPSVKMRRNRSFLFRFKQIFCFKLCSLVELLTLITKNSLALFTRILALKSRNPNPSRFFDVKTCSLFSFQARWCQHMVHAMPPNCKEEPLMSLLVIIRCFTLFLLQIDCRIVIFSIVLLKGIETGF